MIWPTTQAADYDMLCSHSDGSLIWKSVSYGYIYASGTTTITWAVQNQIEPIAFTPTTTNLAGEISLTTGLQVAQSAVYQFEYRVIVVPSNNDQVELFFYNKSLR